MLKLPIIKFFFYLYFVAFLFPLFTFSQQKSSVDSLHTLLQRTKNDTAKIKTLHALSAELLNTGNYAQAMQYANHALFLAEKLNLSQGIAASYNNIGNIYSKQGNDDNALENYFSSLKIYEKILALQSSGSELLTIKQGIGAAYNNIGVIYDSQGNYGKALENYFASLKIREAIGDKQGIAYSNQTIGNIYLQQGNYSNALKNHFAALKIEEEIGDKRGIAMSYQNLGNIYYELGKEAVGLSSFDTYSPPFYFNKALENYFVALKSAEELGDKQGIAISYISMGEIYTEQGSYAKAVAELQKGLALSKEIGAKDLVMVSYQRLSDASAKKNDYKNAYQYHQFYKQWSDSIYNTETSRQIAETQTRYETEKKEREIEIKTLKISEQLRQLTRSRIIVIVSIAASLLLLIIGWLLFTRYKIKQHGRLKAALLRQQELRTKAIIETQEKERHRIAQDLHDGIGHRIAGVKINFQKLTENMNMISPEKQIIFIQALDALDETHKEVRTLSHQMMPKALKEKELADAVSDLLELTFAYSEIKYRFEKHSLENIPSTIHLCLYRVLQELLSNILKHSNAAEITVQMFKTKDTVIMMVEDDGAGIKQNDNTNGIGLENIAGRVHACNGVFLIEPGPVKGTIATVRIPLSVESL